MHFDNREGSIPVPPQQKRRLYAYTAVIVAFPLALLLCAFIVIPTRWFALHSGNTYLANLGYGDTLHNRDCQVLIFGDSSAMVGIDPAMIQKQTGLTACNIAEFEGVTLVSHTSLVDTFLRNNPRPRFIVFLYTPEDLSIPNDWASAAVGTFEAITLQVHSAPGLHTMFLLASHPSATLGWAELGLRMLILDGIHPATLSPEATQLRESTGGQLPIAGDTQARCDNILHNRPPDLAWIAALRAHYAAPGTSVIVDATPTTDCDPSLGFFQHRLTGVIDNAPYLPVPISLYSSDGRLHANRRGVQFLSTMVASQVLARMHQSASPPNPSGTGVR